MSGFLNQAVPVGRRFLSLTVSTWLKFTLRCVMSIFFASAAGAQTNNPVVSGNTAFALDLYKKESAKPGNLFFSPYSLSSALAMTYSGARGQTAEEMARVLHFPLPPLELAPQFAGLARRMDEITRQKEVQLSIANSLWCQKGYSFLPDFLKLTRDFYQAEARIVDFVAQTEAARQEINSWVASATQNKIQDLLHQDDLKRNTLLVLCDAVYFKGQWSHRFDAKATQSAPFFTGPGQQVQIPMMSQALNLHARQFDDFTLFTLPYTSNELSMVVLLPKAVDGLPALERKLEGSELREWLGSLAQAPEEQATIVLPKFKLSCRLTLGKDLASMGMGIAFSAAADFSGMTGHRTLAISDVVHQAFVDVNEEGTEAAAATAVVMVKTAVARQPLIIRADHPFILLIHENQTGSILFLGRVTDPRQ